MVERPVDLGADGKFLVSVAGDAAEIFDETRSFDFYLGVTFAGLGIVLLLTTIFQVRFGLAPLKRISEAIADIRSGRAERLEGEFPVEIAPLARETNALIDANREIVERARTHVGNLAHAIKTPLSVIVNEAAAQRRRSDRRQGAGAGRRDARPGRASSGARPHRRARHRVGTVTEVAPAIEALRRTMEKIHRDRGIAIDVKADSRRKISRRAAGSRGDGRQPRRQRLQMGGIAGASSRCWWSSRPSRRRRRCLRIMVDDDGRGLSEAERAQVARRGQRLDESKPGSGLGLSIVVDLAALYGGSLSLGSAPTGGLRAELVLPGV